MIVLYDMIFVYVQEFQYLNFTKMFFHMYMYI